MIGFLLSSSGGSNLIANESGTLLARGTLADVLSTALASEQGTDAEISIGVTFKDHNGMVCRSFLGNESLTGLVGIACYEGDWRIAALAPAEQATSGSYRTANVAMPAVLRETLAEIIAGDPFDAGQERAAREAGWAAH
jgi:hypothetical protein